MVVIQQQSILSRLLQTGFDLRVIKLDDLPLTLVDHGADCSQHEGHVRRRKSPVSGSDS
jgi:hypothetical protein